MKSKKHIKAKRLSPALRDKRHYLVIKEANKEDIDKAILKNLGNLGYRKVNPKFIRYEKDKIFLSVIRNQVNKVKSSLAMEKIKVVGVSGTIKRARQKFLSK